MPSAATFTAVVRWRGPDPTVEIETNHPGFATPEDAALFANAFSPDAPLGLRLGANASVMLVMTDGRYLPWYAADTTVWTIPPDEISSEDTTLVDDGDFQPQPFSTCSFPPSAVGEYQQAQYGVFDDQGAPVNLSMDWDETDHLRITVEEMPAAPPPIHQDCLLAILPDA
jgi:hypothetical protein